jgi:hypothetical protein
LFALRVVCQHSASAGNRRNAEDDAFHRYYNLLRTIGLSTAEDVVRPTPTWLVCRIDVPEPVERYFRQGFQCWHVEWVEVMGVEGIVLPIDPVLLSLQTIVGLSEEVRDQAENSARMRLVAQPGVVTWIGWRSNMPGLQPGSGPINYWQRSGNGARRR